MALLSMKDVSVSYGGPPVLDKLSLQIEKGDRICLLGRNGAGKSTLLKMVHGEVPPDEGEMVRQPGLRVAHLPQEVPRDLRGTVFQVVSRSASGLANGQVPSSEGEETLHWRREQQVERVISRMELDSAATFETLSAGLKRRVLLAHSLATEPDILLLDEPTNHLDIEAIGWLEDFLLRYNGTLMFVTHDRMFLRKLSTRIMELDRGALVDWPCDYDTFVQRREALLDAESQDWKRQDKKLAQEEAWIRQGIKARRTRNEGRVKALGKLREERRQRRERTGNVRLRMQESERSGKLVLEAHSVSYSYGQDPVIDDFSTIVLRGDKVGIMGPNGAGKTTLLRLLVGELEPQKGRVRTGTRLQVAYFDQLRGQLEETGSVQDNVAGGNDTILFNGKPRHIIGYLQDFLFSPERARSPVSILSGGERNRLLLARLFSKPSNVLILDEPTNDLDAETLELLEELLLDYPGTVFVVSHDRTFLNNVVTSTLVLEGGGKVGEYVGGYDDWLEQTRARSTFREPRAKVERKKPKTDRPRRLTYKEQRELEELPERIEALEAEQKALYDAMADPELYKKDSEQIVRAKSRLETLEVELRETYERWEALEAMAS